MEALIANGDVFLLVPFAYTPRERTVVGFKVCAEKFKEFLFHTCFFIREGELVCFKCLECLIPP